MNKITAILYALLAAVFYALNAPGSKLLLGEIPPTILAGLLYLGAGVGVGLMSLVRRTMVRPEGSRADDHDHHHVYSNDDSEKIEEHIDADIVGDMHYDTGAAKDNRLTHADLPYVIGMVLLDIAAPILLMFGLTYANASEVSLLNNFEIVATTVIALLIFKENVTLRMWIGVIFITVSSILLSYEGTEEITLSWGALLVLGATVCWGFENNCTRKISDKSTYEIVFIKGIFSGLGSLIIGLIIGEKLPGIRFILLAMLLGFVAYGLSIFFYIRAQSVIGAAKTSAYYAVAPFIGALISFILLKEALSGNYLVALIFMIAGSAIVVADTLIMHHTHMHKHVITHTHDGSTHTHVIEHSHEHTHFGKGEAHHHTHPDLNPHSVTQA